MISVIYILYNDTLIVSIEYRLGVEALIVIIMNFNGDEYYEMVRAHGGMGFYTFTAKKTRFKFEEYVNSINKSFY